MRIAYRLWHDGKHKQRIRKGREAVLIPTGVQDENGKPIWIAAADVGRYVNDDFWAAYEIYAMSELMGCMPFKGGWADQPSNLVRAIAAIKMECKLIESEKASG